jgi:hypothetical protein
MTSFVDSHRLLAPALAWPGWLLRGQFLVNIFQLTF